MEEYVISLLSIRFEIDGDTSSTLENDTPTALEGHV